MRVVVAAIHGILTGQTDASWPDRLDAWMCRRAPEVKVLKKEYRAGPFPRWNCLFKNPALACGLAAELDLFLQPAGSLPSIWLAAHSNGAVIALETTQRLIARGRRVDGLILTGAACEADIAKNGVGGWLRNGLLGAAIAYSSADDSVVAGDPRAATTGLEKLRSWIWGRLIWPYGCLGRTGWTGRDEVRNPKTERSNGREPVLLTRWFRGGHSAYFAAEKIERTFEQMRHDILEL